MKRRALWWSLAILVLLGVIGSSLLLLSGNAAQFRFLEGQEPAYRETSEDLVRMGFRPGAEMTYYALKTDYDAYKRVVERELFANGYGRATPYDGNGERYVKHLGTGGGRYFISVTLMKDMRPWQTTGFGNLDDKGWVTVNVFTSRPVTTLEKLRQWLGL